MLCIYRCNYGSFNVRHLNQYMSTLIVGVVVRESSKDHEKKIDKHIIAGIHLKPRKRLMILKFSVNS